MNEDFSSRAWVDHKPAFARAIADVVRTAATGLATLNAKQFEAPWRTGSDTACPTRP